MAGAADRLKITPYALIKTLARQRDGSPIVDGLIQAFNDKKIGLVAGTIDTPETRRCYDLSITKVVAV